VLRDDLEIAEFATAEGKRLVCRVFAGIGVSQRRQQQRSRVRAHVKTVGN